MSTTDLSVRPVYDTIDERKLALITNTVAKGASREETAMFLELAAKYDLDPFAREIWCAKSPGRDGSEGRLLLIVGRDGLRKIAQRNGMSIASDVVCEQDEFCVERVGDKRAVTHRYGQAAERGPIVGAYAQCISTDGREAGFFYARMSEYRPKSEQKLKFSPWGSQESVMILAAAERQALRQATPLSGLLAEGELDLNEERADAVLVDDADALSAAIVTSLPTPRLAAEAERLITELNGLLPGTWTPAKVELTFRGLDADRAHGELELLERLIAEHQPAPADVVPERPDPSAVEPRAETSE